MFVQIRVKIFIEDKEQIPFLQFV